MGGPAERAGAALAVQLVQGVGDLPRLLHRPRYLDRAEVGGGRRGVPRGGGEGVLRLVLPVRVALLRRARPDDPPQGAGAGEEPDADVARCSCAGVTGGEAAVGGAGESAAQPLHLARRGPAAPQFPVGVPRPLGDQGLVGARLGVVVVEGERAVETGGGRGDGRPGRERCGEGYSGAHGQGGRQDAASGGRGSGGSGRRGGRSMRSDGHDDSWNRGVWLLGAAGSRSTGERCAGKGSSAVVPVGAAAPVPQGSGAARRGEGADADEEPRPVTGSVGPVGRGGSRRWSGRDGAFAQRLRVVRDRQGPGLSDCPRPPDRGRRARSSSAYHSRPRGPWFS